MNGIAERIKEAMKEVVIGRERFEIMNEISLDDIKEDKKYYFPYNLCFCAKEMTPSEWLNADRQKCPDCLEKEKRAGRLKMKQLTNKDAMCLAYWFEKNGERGQLLREEYSEKNIVDPDEIIASSGMKVIWKCRKCSNEWEAGLRNRTVMNHNCPSCARKLAGDNIRKTLVEKGTSLDEYIKTLGELGDEIRSEWTGIADDGRHYEMSEISPKSALQLKWVCPKCNEIIWATPLEKTDKNKRCPSCYPIVKCTSYPEQLLFHCMKQLFPLCTNRDRFFVSKKHKQGLELDVYMPEINTAIEYGAWAWHKSRRENDRDKRIGCKNDGIRLIEIIDISGTQYKHMEYLGKNLIVKNVNSREKDKIVYELLTYLLPSIGHKIEEIDFENAKKEAYKSSRGKTVYEDSIEVNFPELAKEVHPDNEKSASEIRINSEEAVKWICPVCKYTRSTKVSCRVRQKSGCKHCGYNWYKKMTGESQNYYEPYRSRISAEIVRRLF